MYKRLELHNHTNESDGNLTPDSLANFMLDDGVDAFALTDHNTISGHPKLQQFLSSNSHYPECIYGMEYTTYYGHILCFNLKEYIPWENINRHHPEKLFLAIKEKGALAGVAHPFSYGYPIGTCRFDMTFTDFSCIDFIEIFNNPEPLYEVNKLGLEWWEDLILKGHRIAFTSGMDLHNTSSMHHHFATFIEGTLTGCIETELETAITSQKTWISKGPLLISNIDHENKCITFSIHHTTKPGYHYTDCTNYHLSLRTQTGTLSYAFKDNAPLSIPYSDLSINSPIISKLYAYTEELSNLVCVSPVIYL